MSIITAPRIGANPGSITNASYGAIGGALPPGGSGAASPAYSDETWRDRTSAGASMTPSANERDTS